MAFARIGAGLLTACVLAAGPLTAEASVDPCDKPVDVDARPSWPAKALKDGTTGHATLACSTAELAALRQCRVVEEEPKGVGFGEAALKLVRNMRCTTAQPLGSGVTTTFDFDRIRYDTEPDWLSLPTFSMVDAVIPNKAITNGVGGRVLLDCTVTVQGVPTDCKVIAETPQDFGFGHAAMQLIQFFQFKPATKDGRAVEDQVTIPFGFGRFQPNNSMNSIPVLSDPVWLREPTAPDIDAAYPQEARNKGLAGFAVIRCAVDRDGTLSACISAREQPEGHGFAKAAIRLAAQYVADMHNVAVGPRKPRVFLATRFPPPDRVPAGTPASP